MASESVVGCGCGDTDLVVVWQVSVEHAKCAMELFVF